MTDMALRSESAVDVATPRRGSLERSRRISNRLLRELVRIDASKRCFALDLEALFHRSRGLSMRLALADYRRRTKAQLDRLCFIIAIGVGRDQPVAAPTPKGNFDLRGIGPLPNATVFGLLLRASLAAAAQYETAVAAAAAERMTFAVKLLTTSLAEEQQAVDRFVSMVRLIDTE